MNTVSALLCGAGLDGLAKVATRLCQMYLGLPEEKRSWCRCADESLCKSLLLDALANGNFGRKRTAVLDYNYGMNLYDIKHPLKLIKTIQHTGKEKLERKGHKKTASMFGWLHQSIYLASRWRKLRTTGETRDANKISKKRSGLIAALGLPAHHLR